VKKVVDVHNRSFESLSKGGDFSLSYAESEDIHDLLSSVCYIYIFIRYTINLLISIFLFYLCFIF
jgi:hypothetical protein